jgi:hypothetical protein
MSSENFSLGPYVHIKMSSENFSLGPNWQMKNFQLTNSEDRRAYNSEGRRDDNSKGNLSRERKREMIMLFLPDDNAFPSR